MNSHGNMTVTDSQIAFEWSQLKPAEYYQPRSPTGDTPETAPFICLPFIYQDALFSVVQDILEYSLFNFAKDQQRTRLEELGVESYRQLQLNVWPRFLDTLILSFSSVLRDAFSTGSEMKCSIGGQPYGSSGEDTLKDALRRISQLRHVTVHRCLISILLVRDMLVDSCRICWSLRLHEI